MNRISHYLPEIGSEYPTPGILHEDRQERPERDPWHVAGEIVGTGLSLLLCAAGILAGVWLVGYVGALGVCAGLGL